MQGKSISWQQRAAELNAEAENYGKLGRATAIQLAAAVLCLLAAALCVVAVVAMIATYEPGYRSGWWAITWRAAGVVVALLIAAAFLSVFLRLWAETWQDVGAYRLYVQRQRAAKIRGLDALGGLQTDVQIEAWSASEKVFGAVVAAYIALYFEQKDQGHIGGIRKYEDLGFWLGQQKLLTGSFHGVRGVLEKIDAAGLFEGREEGQRGRLAEVDLEEGLRRLTQRWKYLES